MRAFGVGSPEELRERYQSRGAAGVGGDAAERGEEPADAGGWHYLFFDGACPGNPGLCGGGAALYSASAETISTGLWKWGYGSNNLGEYAGLTLGLQLASRAQVRRLRIVGDSMLVIQQVLGHWECRSQTLTGALDTARDLLREFEMVQWQHVPRARNGVADALAGHAVTLSETFPEYFQGEPDIAPLRALSAAARREVRAVILGAWQQVGRDREPRGAMRAEEGEDFCVQAAWHALEGFRWDQLGGVVTHEDGAREFIQAPPVVRRVFGLARQYAGDALQQVMDWTTEEGLTEGDRETRYMLLYHWPVLCLRRPTRRERQGGGRRGRRAVSAVLAERLRRFQQGDWSGLLHEALEATSSGRRLPSGRDTRQRRQEQEDYTRLAVVRQVWEGSTSRALRRLLSQPMATGTERTVRALEERHPAATLPIPDWVRDYQPPAHARIADPEVPSLRGALRTAARGAAGGPLGLTLDLLRDICLESDDIMGSLCRVVGAHVRGEVPGAAARVLGRSRLIALLKGEVEEEGVRPIAMGEALHRLTGRWLAYRSRAAMTRALVPLQFGVGLSDGASMVVRGVQGSLAAHDDWGVLSLDIANAFNSVERSAIFEALRSRGFGHWIPFVRQYYAESGDLLYMGVQCPALIHSARGVRQGDPLGPFLFSLAYQQVLEAGQHAMDGAGGGRVSSYLDDSPLVGPVPALEAGLGAMVEEGGRIGLRFNLRKSSLHRVPEGVQVPAGLSQVHHSQDGIELLGVPLGTDTFVQQWREEWLQEALRGVSELQRLGDPQAALWILRECIVSRPLYALRLLPPDPGWLEILRRFDTAVFHCLEVISLGRDDGAALIAPSCPRRLRARRLAARQVQLPLSQGGLGLHGSEGLAAVSYVCATARALGPLLEHFGEMFAPGTALQYLCPGWEGFVSMLSPSVRALIPPLASLSHEGCPDRLYQRARAALEAIQLEALEEATRQGRDGSAQLRRLWATRGAGACAWITARPSGPEDQLYLAPDDFRIILRYWLGLPVQHYDVTPSEYSRLDPDMAPLMDPWLPLPRARTSLEGRVTSCHRAVQLGLAQIMREVGVRPRLEDDTIFPAPPRQAQRQDSGAQGDAEGAAEIAAGEGRQEGASDGQQAGDAAGDGQPDGEPDEGPGEGRQQEERQPQGGRRRQGHLIPDITMPDRRPGGGQFTWAVDVVTVDAQLAAWGHPGHALHTRERDKERHYRAAAAAHPAVSPIPFAIDTFGGLGVRARELLGRLAVLRLGRARDEDSVELSGRLQHFYTQRIVVAHHRRQSHLIRDIAMRGFRQVDPDLHADASRMPSSSSRHRHVGVSDIWGIHLPDSGRGVE